MIDKTSRAIAIEQLSKAIEKNDDPEVAHRQADVALCMLLQSIGYEDVVELYEKVRRWYA